MNLLEIIQEVIDYSFPYHREVDKIKDAGGKFIDHGFYGSVFELNGKAVKVTTDTDEIEHAKKLKGRDTVNFVHIFDVKRLSPTLGIITMELLEPRTSKIPRSFLIAVKKEAKDYGIDPDELDIRPSNVMKSPSDGHLKMIDV